MLPTERKKNFVRLIKEHQALIHCICTIYYTQEEDRKDAFQDIVLQLWKAYPSFRGASKISTWIYSVGLRTVLAKIRKEHRQPPQESLSDFHQSVGYAPAYADDEMQLLHSIIGQLNDLDKGMVMLYLDEHSYQEIATILNMTVSNVSTRINRIKAKLKKMYHKEYDGLR